MIGGRRRAVACVIGVRRTVVPAMGRVIGSRTAVSGVGGVIDRCRRAGGRVVARMSGVRRVAAGMVPVRCGCGCASRSAGCGGAVRRS
ncbi:hypothetical protein, partial [Nocardia cyriacigeorgica]|uniref:hypothetical protein n=1 Tax=Nocardia cyriacigeorgica TaxID=135487 RepID=UPI001C49B9BD